MFDQTFVNAHPHARRPWTMAVSLSLQTGLVALAVILPMLHPEILRPKLETPVYLPMRPKPVQQPIEPKVLQSAARTRRPYLETPLMMPTKIPPHASVIADAPPEMPGAVTAGSFSGSSAIFPGVIPGFPERAATPPQTSVVVKPELPKGPMHVSSGVQSALLLFGPKPTYPQLAKAARVQGTVRIQAIIAAGGVIRNLQVISGPPLLVNAALDAVKQWRYRPTTLNGSVVEVITEIDVNFTLSQ